ncbi:MAG: hypothetical protein M3O41_03215 [Pseudomonadota bacterium]|nr:hypothetical protein [Pseudomonadota bacterium]
MTVIVPYERQRYEKRTVQIWAHSRPLALAILRLDYDRRAVWHDPNYLIDLAIRNRDTSVGPIDGSVRTANPPETVFHTVHHDETSRNDTSNSSRGYIILAGIGDMQRTPK